MNIILVTIPVTLFLGLAFLAAYAWAVSTGQFDNLDSDSQRFLNEEREKRNGPEH